MAGNSMTLIRLWAATGILMAIAAAATTGASLFEAKLPRGIDFTLQNSPTPQKHLIETMPGGVALLDYSNAGLLDIFFVNGVRLASPLPTALPTQEDFDRHDPRYWNRLYRQNKDGSFTEVNGQGGVGE